MADIFLTRKEYERLTSDMDQYQSERDQITHYFIRDPVENTEEGYPEERGGIQIRFRKQSHIPGRWHWVAVDDIYVDDEAVTREM